MNTHGYSLRITIAFILTIIVVSCDFHIRKTVKVPYSTSSSVSKKKGFFLWNYDFPKRIVIGDSIDFIINDAFAEYSYNYKSYESDDIEKNGYISVVLAIGQCNDFGRKNYGKTWYIDDYYSNEVPHFIVYSFPEDSIPDTLNCNVYGKSIHSEKIIERISIIRSTNKN